MRTAGAALVSVVLFAIGCGGGQSASPAPSNRLASPPDAAITTSCYPYVMRDGACFVRCDWSKPREQQGCVVGEWPLICNSDGTCTPEQNFEQP